MAPSDLAAARGHCSTPARLAHRRDAFLRLRSLPWRRVDVEFRGAPLCAHNDVQGTWRWLKVYGLTVPLHMVRELDQLEQALAAGSEKEPQAAQ